MKSIGHSSTVDTMEPSLADRIRLLDQEQQREMNELVRIKTNQYTKNEDFEDCYPIDKLLEL